jgi:ATP-dependent RNA helicase RhlE
MKKSQKTQKESTRQNKFQPISNRSSQSKRFVRKSQNADWLVKQSQSDTHKEFKPTLSIQDLPVHESIVSNLIRKGYQLPTEIQEKSIGPILNGKDIMGLAQTGSGKTGAFLIPLAHSLLGKGPTFQILVITPTRELAVQIEEEFRSITLGLRLFSECLIGGTSVRRDIMKLKRPYHIIVGTPGRINDMVRQGAVDMHRFSVLVLDEFDRLLDMGFAPDILQIVEGMHNRRQTILYSATENKTQKALIGKLLKSPVEVRAANGGSACNHIEQEVIKVTNGESKLDILLNLFKDPSCEKVLIFDDTKRGVTRICKDLRKAGIKADEIHGDKSQNYRINALEAFRNKRIRVLVATDVAARGLDIANVSHVINYQPPRCFENYLHRIGRTGRAGKSGKAYTFSH